MLGGPMTFDARRQGKVPGGNDQAGSHWEERLRRALEHDGFALYQQPIVDLRTGSILRHELLLRLVEGDRVTPTVEFFDVATRYGPIVEIDLWVCDRAIEIAAGGKPVTMNLASQSITPGFVRHVRERLIETGANPANLTFELSERDLVTAEARAREFLWRLSELGFELAVDQFGTGPAELVKLRSLPVGYLKLGREFARDLSREPGSRDAIEAIVKPARRFGSRTVVVGVEDLATLQTLEELGADEAQGFALGAPEPIEDEYSNPVEQPAA
jgi:EAL domain-containing protein (putative c-di-GMP-specific phosphodiesterase class I)